MTADAPVMHASGMVDLAPEIYRQRLVVEGLVSAPISAEQIEKITPGTSRNEVRFILGTPLIEDPFHAERWDYFYSLDPAKGELVTKYRLSVWFENVRENARGRKAEGSIRVIIV